jgi:hypothetical protein
MSFDTGSEDDVDKQDIINRRGESDNASCQRGPATSSWAIEDEWLLKVIKERYRYADGSRRQTNQKDKKPTRVFAC